MLAKGFTRNATRFSQNAKQFERNDELHVYMKRFSHEMVCSLFTCFDFRFNRVLPDFFPNGKSYFKMAQYNRNTDK